MREALPIDDDHSQFCTGTRKHVRGTTRLRLVVVLIGSGEGRAEMQCKEDRGGARKEPQVFLTSSFISVISTEKWGKRWGGITKPLSFQFQMFFFVAKFDLKWLWLGESRKAGM